MLKRPPVPPAARSPKGTSSNPRSGDTDIKPEKELENLREQGHTGMIDQNTHNQGYQQDR
jgi:hypothetical protein